MSLVHKLLTSSTSTLAKTKSSRLYLTINIHHYLTFNSYFNILQYRHVDELTLTMTYYKIEPSSHKLTAITDGLSAKSGIGRI